jgi:hypothetical protein
MIPDGGYPIFSNKLARGLNVIITASVFRHSSWAINVQFAANPVSSRVDQAR